MKRLELYKIINEMNLRGNAVEVGVYKGDFAWQWISNTHFKKTYLVDPYKKYSKDIFKTRDSSSQEELDIRYENVKTRFEKFENKIEIVRKESKAASEMFPDNFFDFIYIDANHNYDFIKEDLALWYPKLKNISIFSGHDYFSKGHKGVKRAVDEFFYETNKKIMITSEKRASSWYLVNNV